MFDLETNDYIIYDNHEIIYAYGDLDKLKNSLIKKGFIEGVFEIPCPHSHHFNKEFDCLEERLFDYWEWMFFPLIDDVDE